VKQTSEEGQEWEWRHMYMAEIITDDSLSISLAM